MSQGAGQGAGERSSLPTAGQLLLTAAVLLEKHGHSRNKEWRFGWQRLLFTNQEKTKGHRLYVSKLTITLKWKTDIK